MTECLLAVDELEKSFPVRRGPRNFLRPASAGRVTAVDRVSFELRRGETLGIVGESGCGKSTLARCLVHLHPPDGGRIMFDGVEVAHPRKEELRSLRRRVQMVFQDPYGSLNPRMTVEKALLEAGRVHGRVASGGERGFVIELLETVGLPASTATARPRQLSGGQRQRVAIARALAVRPEVLIADEAVSGLDVSIQAQILTLLDDLKQQLGLSMIFISHQLSVVSYIADRVAVMYLGRIVEYGPVAEVFETAQHPYTKALLDADPTPDPTRKRRSAAAIGDVPSSLSIPTGCRFRSRCPYEQEICTVTEPGLEPVTEGHLAACHVLPFPQPPRHQRNGTGSDPFSP